MSYFYENSRICVVRRYFAQNNSNKLDFSAFGQIFKAITHCVPLLCFRFKPQVMNKVLIVIAFLIIPFFATAQNDSKIVMSNIDTTINVEVAIKKIDHISINPKTQNLDLNFKKSNDIISVEAYIKSLQLKRKATVMS